MNAGMSASKLLAHMDSGAPWDCASGAVAGTDVAAAYQLQLAVRDLRIARGEHPRGFKIGFTNRGIWPRYQVFAPIWGTVWDSTLTLCDGEAGVPLRPSCQPRIEPEAVFGMRATPPAGATLQQLFESIEWVAPGFEIVQSHLPDWKFCAADTVADGALHARLLVGRRIALRDLAPDASTLQAVLAAAVVRLLRGDQEVERGHGANVLDDPLRALHHFLGELRACPNAPELLPGDVVTTGTWTDAWPIAAGESWTADFGATLGRLRVRLSDR